MKFSRPEADIFVPDGSPAEAALARTTHLCVVAHQDDIEILAYPGVAECYGSGELHFTGVVATNGAGSPRAGPFAGHSDGQMQAVRREEQRAAARLGRYNLQIQLAHPSAAVKDPAEPGPAADLAALFAGAPRVRVVYLHNPADKHDTHVAVLLRSLEALRRLPRDRRPKRALACEGWRGLDWALDSDKIALDAGARPELARRLIEVFASQVAGGKRYDVAALGRRAANATFSNPHQTDALRSAVLALDLTPLLEDDGLSLRDFTLRLVDRLRDDVAARLDKFIMRA